MGAKMPIATAHRTSSVAHPPALTRDVAPSVHCANKFCKICREKFRESIELEREIGSVETESYGLVAGLTLGTASDARVQAPLPLDCP